MEKRSGIGSSTLKEMAKFINKNPRTSLGLLVGGAGALYTAGKINSIAKNIHPIHQIAREETKNKLLISQNQMMKALLESNIDIKKSLTKKPSSNKIKPSLS